MLQENSDDILTLTIGRSKAVDDWYFHVIYASCFVVFILLVYIFIRSSYIQRKLVKWERFKYIGELGLFTVMAIIVDMISSWIRRSIILVPKH